MLSLPGQSVTTYTFRQNGPSVTPTPGQPGTAPLIGVGSGRCLDVPGAVTTNGTVVKLYDRNGGAHQRWTLNGDSTVRAVQSGLCLDVSGAATANGSAVILWNCSGAANQQWRRG